MLCYVKKSVYEEVSILCCLIHRHYIRRYVYHAVIYKVTISVYKYLILCL